MRGRRNPFVAHEGIPFLLASALSTWLAWRFLDNVWLGLAAFVFVLLFLVFRDPRRPIPPEPLGVVSPVDGEVLSIERIDGGVIEGGAHVISIDIDGLGTYTARCPVEGKVMDAGSVADERTISGRGRVLWVQTDESDDVILRFSGNRFGLAPKALTRYGERLGQGARCAYLRLVREAVVHVPVESKLLVKAGDRVIAGSDLLARLPHS